MNEEETLAGQIEAAHRCLDILSRRAGGWSVGKKASTTEAVEELSASLEALAVAADDLQRRNEWLEEVLETSQRERQHCWELFEFAPAGYLVTDDEGVVQEANHTASVLLHVDESLLMGRSLIDFVADEERDAFRARTAQMRSGKADRIVDWWLPLEPEEGSSLWASVTVTGVSDSTGELVGLRWQLQDVTERKWAEKALLESERRYRTIASSIQDGLTIIEDGKVVYVNNRACEIFGYPRDEYVKMTGVDFAAPEERDRVSRIVDRIRRTGTLPRELEYWVVRKDGTRRCVRNRYSRIRGGEGTLSGSRLVVTTDITERKRAEEALRESEELHRTTLESISDAVLITDDGGAFTYVCGNVEIVFGHTFQELYAFGNIDRLLGEGLFDAEELKRLGEIENIECSVLDKHGRQHTLLVNVKRVSIGQGTILYTCRDITAHRWAEEALRETEERLMLLLESAEDIIVLQDLDGMYLYYNGPSRYSLEPEDVIGKTPFDLFESPTAAEIVRQVKQVAESGQSKMVERSLYWQDETVWFADHVYPVRDEIGSITAVATISRNITQRRHAEEALRKSEARYRAIFETTGTATIIIEEDTTISLANAEFERLSGYSREEIEDRKSWMEFVVEDDRERMEAYHRLRRTDPEAAPRNYEFRFLDKEGNLHNIFLTIAMIPGTGQSIAALLDVTEHKRADEALKRRIAQLAILNDVGEKIAAVLKLDSLLERAVRLVQESFGYHHVAVFTLEDGQGELMMRARAGDFAALFPPDHRLELEQGMVGWVARHGEKLLACDVRAEPHYVNLYPDVIPTRSELSVPIRVGEEIVGVLDVQSPQFDAFDANDVVVMETLADQMAVAIENARLYEAVHQELAERRRAEMALRESEKKYRELTNLLPQSVFELDLQGNFTFANRYAFQATGYTQEDVDRGLSALQLFVPEDRDRAQRNLQRILRGESTGGHEYTALRKDGATFPVIIYSSPIVLGDEPVGVRGIVVDITERKRLEQYALRTERLAAMEHVAAALAHEIKNPLQAVQSHLELLLDFPLGSDERQEYLRFSRQEVEHISEITEHVLSLARPLGDTLYPVSLSHLVKRTLTLVGVSLQQARVQVASDIPPELPPVLVAPDQVIQALLSLVLNSIEAMPEGGHLDITASTDGDMAVLVLTNDGPPIPPEDIERLFEPSFSTKPDGTGMGLFISHSVVERHGGTMDVENLEDGRGVAFTIRLPMRLGRKT